MGSQAQPAPADPGAGWPAELRIGSLQSGINFFKGTLDDVQLFSRALNAGEVSALYEGSSPLLALAFDTPDMRVASALADSSGWEQLATLQTGASDSASKAIAGRVGTAAVALDGKDDYVQVSDSPVFDLGTGAFAMSFWFKKDRAARVDALSWKNTDSGGNDDVGIILRSRDTGAACRLEKLLFLVVCGGFAAAYYQKRKILGGPSPPNLP